MGLTRCIRSIGPNRLAVDVHTLTRVTMYDFDNSRLWGGADVCLFVVDGFVKEQWGSRFTA